MSKIILTLIFFFLSLNSFASDQFIFDVTEIEITDNGNKFIGTKRGVAKSDNGIIIDAEQFEYNKILNILNAKGKVKITDTVNNYITIENTGTVDYTIIFYDISNPIFVNSLSNVNLGWNLGFKIKTDSARAKSGSDGTISPGSLRQSPTLVPSGPPITIMFLGNFLIDSISS